MSERPQARLREVEVQALDAARLESLIGTERMAHYEAVADATQAALAGHAVLNVNSTATGGGVAEMLQTLLAYVRGAGIDARWLVIEGDREFFAITKRIHNGLYGGPGDGGELGKAERSHYERVLHRNAEELLALVRPEDVVLIHDPQPVGLVEAVKRAGARVVWRCHVGSDEPNRWTERAWEFIRPYLQETDAFVFSSAAFAPPWAEPSRTHVIPPSIDPFSAKNEPMSHRNVRLALSYAGLLDGDGNPPVVPFTRRDGSPGRINRHVDVVQNGPAARPDAPLVIQASRWDHMKDMAGVMEGFAEHVDPALGAHLVLAGPAVTGVADDPEAAEVYDDCVDRWRRLAHATRGRVHLACIPMADADENAAIVNALQRHASVVVQKSLAEGFGLTVTEAMWKSRPIVASGVGGIADQITDGEHGLLIGNPHDLPAFGAAVERLLREPEEAARLGANARTRAATEFLGDRHLDQYGQLFASLG
ncbi:MAG TPA: glycosyltransferase [Solirubrobacteraceae bacterium]|nr:glycosyltransferase [Solirubrobacteraceae bacterium]